MSITPQFLKNGIPKVRDATKAILRGETKQP